MIFVSIALLVVAAIALGVGIASSSVPPLVVSILVTLAAAGTLWASFIRYRAKAAEEGAHVQGLGGNEPRHPGWPQVYGTGPAAVPAAAPGAPPPVDPWKPAAPAGWDDLPEAEAAEQVQAFNLDELHDLRRHEVEHAHRDQVLAAIDARVDDLVALRRRLSSH